MNKEAKILIGVALAVLIGGAALFLFANPQPKDAGQAVDSQSLVRETSNMTGKKEAKVTIVEFGDYQCPACAAAHPIIKQVLEDYKNNDQVNLVYRQFPLVTIHKNAMLASQAALAAGEQGKFWEMHNKLYEAQTQWSESLSANVVFESYALSLGLDVVKFNSALSQNLFREVVNTDIKDGEALGVNSTPTFYLNGQKLNSIPSVEEWKQKIEEGLKK